MAWRKRGYEPRRLDAKNPCVFDVCDTSGDQHMTILGDFSGFSAGSHFWTLLGVILEYFWGSFGSPIGVLGVSVGNLGDPLAPPGDPLGALWHPWGSHVASLGALWPFFGTLGGRLEGPWAPTRDLLRCRFVSLLVLGWQTVGAVGAPKMLSQTPECVGGDPRMQGGRPWNVGGRP